MPAMERAWLDSKCIFRCPGFDSQGIEHSNHGINSIGLLQTKPGYVCKNSSLICGGDNTEDWHQIRNICRGDRAKIL